MQKLKAALLIGLAILSLSIWVACNVYLAGKLTEFTKCENQSVSSQKTK